MRELNNQLFHEIGGNIMCLLPNANLEEISTLQLPGFKFRLVGLHCYLHLNGSARVTNTLAYPLSRCIGQPDV